MDQTLLLFKWMDMMGIHTGKSSKTSITRLSKSVLVKTLVSLNVIPSEYIDKHYNKRALVPLLLSYQFTKAQVNMIGAHFNNRST